MYARRVKGRTLTFAVSGKLWKRSLVMIDKETGSLWSHILGEAMRGTLKGAILKSLPSAMTDWKSWREKHPKTTVVLLSRTSRKFQKNYYRNPKAFVMGYVSGEHARAWSFDRLRKHPVINDRIGVKPLLVTFYAGSNAPYLFDRTVDGKPLTFESRDRKVLDTATRSEWDYATGRCLRGKLRGKQLTPLPGIVSFRRAWERFHPKTEYWKPDTAKRR